ncbi:glutathione peroxidase [Aquibacillus rhizosphaerae]|uniref:Glutathione peroxidase n=1 Tax=Aquibacillus rhizosphaerae TaxID=3051431 RepID=A0ABT7LBA5_9BACI|nr:glutathione peroxidase [Aquibacillus sp. LR5S19]MDL4843151.1 glutathione peroxidase [Aquibacillus sp. LR5S19]
MSIYDITVNKPNGNSYPLSEYEGKVMLIVNTATKCGLSGQFDGLEEIYQNYKDKGLVVLGFPSNQFANQEPGTSEEAEETCRINFGVTFPIHEKITVNGKNTHELFQHLKNNTKGFLSKEIKWNFTKFLVDQNGEVIDRFGPQVEPAKIEEKIRKILA